MAATDDTTPDSAADALGPPLRLPQPLEDAYESTVGRWGSSGGIYWAARGLGFVIVLAVFSGAIGSGVGSRHVVYTIVQLSIVAPLLVLLAYVDLRGSDRVSGRLHELQFGAIVTLAVTGAITARLGLQSVTIAYTVGACYEGGHQLSVPRSLIVLGAGILGVVASIVLFGFQIGALLGWPLLMIACLSVGYLRRLSRERGDRLESLMAQMRLAQERELRAAALEERHRIAREIHDVLAQSLSALGLQVQAARAVLLDRGDVERALELLDRAQTLADRGFHESRDAIEALRSDSPPLPEALASLVEARERDRPGSARLAIDGDRVALPAAVSLALIRVAQEAVANADRHAPGHLVELALGYAPHETTLVVTNAGPPQRSGADSPGSGGYGLAGMRERVGECGGSLAAGPTADGWSVTARVPR